MNSIVVMNRRIFKELQDRHRSHLKSSRPWLQDKNTSHSCDTIPAKHMIELDENLKKCFVFYISPKVPVCVTLLGCRRCRDPIKIGGRDKEYHLVGSTVIALTLKSGDGSGKSRPLGQSLSRTWSNKKRSLQINHQVCLPFTLYTSN